MSTERPSSAGMYDYYLGGTANSALDRAAADRLHRILPEISEAAWANRGFLQRAVRLLAAERGIHQFIDLGAGLPTQRHTHEVVAGERPDGRVLYVDFDPAVVGRGQRILAGVTGVGIVEADVRAVETVLAHPRTLELIDFDRPVALLAVAVTQFLPDDDDPWALIRRYLDAVPSGSYLVLAAGTTDNQSERLAQRVRDVYAGSTTPVFDRDLTQFERFLDGLEILPPYAGSGAKVVHAGQWGAEDPEVADDDGSRWSYAAVARKP